MNKDIIQGHWTELKGKVRKHWNRFTDDEVGEMQGTAQELKGRLQKKYGYAEDEAQEEIDNFLRENKYYEEEETLEDSDR